MESFATVDDYIARYGEVEDPDQVSTLLDDASAFICGQPGFTALAEGEPGYEAQRANLTRVACAVVRRSLSAGQWVGLSSVSQTAGSYSASASVANPTEDFYMTKAEKRSLGITGAAISTVRPAIHRPRCARHGGEPIW